LERKEKEKENPVTCKKPNGEREGRKKREKWSTIKKEKRKENRPVFATGLLEKRKRESVLVNPGGKKGKEEEKGGKIVG